MLHLTSSSLWTLYWITHSVAVGFLGLCSLEASSKSNSLVWLQKLLKFVKQFGEHGKTHNGSNWMTVPKRLFVHFYFVGVAVNVFMLWLNRADLNKSYISWLYQIQVSRRLYESLFVTHWSKTSQMNVVHYILGVTYYVAAPFTLLAAWDGSLSLDTSLFWILALLFCGLNWQQYQAHRILAELRSSASSASATNPKYSIPRGGLFEYLSCPHYFIEVSIYGIFVLLSRCSPSVLALFVFVFGELTFSAYVQHSWYIEKFDSYPRNRFAIYYGIL
jgi:3-oxo-5-alpha-steroid 4-dehydrogenase 3 / polyprenol reductase